MAANVRIRTLRREDYPQAPAWFDALLLVLNQALGDTANALNGGLTFAENMKAELKTVEVTMPAEFPTWRAVGTPGNPAFKNGFTQWLSGNSALVGFRMWPNGMVELRGTIMLPAVAPALGTVMYTLPQGYAPAFVQRIVIPQSSVARYIEILQNGDVIVGATGAAWSPGSGWAEFDNIRFHALGTAVRADAFAAPFPMSVKTSGRFPVATCNVARVVDKTDTTSTGPIGPCSVDWEPDGAGIKLKAIWGLQPGRKYDVTLLLTAG